ncbi:MAG: Diadenylate cyclase spyDAC; Bacterial checkpoint controller DisA with nucleotide-binding domain [uncultured Thermomicrobiales bacterium]|uniref:Diadenylate cyclase n=1 Tax=uncultured Thermomicrobiales bacterium TaxID=1645740 RepID=A0A6J4UMA2_9BACT|nr:MAG: Diadenylate cyclase spyDAC; Bacterial checkpoint controller DisA with nucleotide-binding domain [uncultured Thermomicrobiales bacterium]
MPDVGWLVFRLLDFRTLLDITVVSIIIYWLLWVAQGTRATQLLRGIVILSALVFFLANTLQLTTFNWLLRNLWPALVVAIPIIFQTELRRALEQLGHAGSWLRPPFQNATSNEAMERMVDEIVRAGVQLSRQRFGALIVIERETGLQDFADRGVPIHGDLTRQLLITVFFPNSPLHDAAVLVRGDRIVAASVVLPLTDNISATGQLGTRHRAAIGITEESDALAVVVSEETGQMSVAHNGRLIRNLDQDRLRRVLRSLLRLDRPDSRAQSSSWAQALQQRLSESNRTSGRTSPIVPDVKIGTPKPPVRHEPDTSKVSQ